MRYGVNTPIVNNKHIMRKRIIEDPHFAYITWFNDFLTVKCFAEYFKLDLKTAKNIINKGRAIHYSL